MHPLRTSTFELDCFGLNPGSGTYEIYGFRTFI